MGAKTAPAWHLVASSEELPDGGRLIVRLGAYEIGVFRINGALKAYENNCVHQGGPVCQGKIMPAVKEILTEDARTMGSQWDREDMRIVCPWHGFEYRFADGSHPGDPSATLTSFDIDERGGQIFVRC